MLFIATAGRPVGSGKGMKKKPDSKLKLNNKPENKKTLSLEAKEPEKFKCCACGTPYQDQTKNFPYSYSAFFKGNNNRLPICNNCFNSATDQYTNDLNSQDEAIKRMCLHWDYYIDENTLQSVKKIDASRSRIKEYVKRFNLGQLVGKTYDTFL